MLQNICKRTFLHYKPQRFAQSFVTVVNSNAAEETNAKYNTDETPISEQHWDEFTKEFMQNRIEMTPFQKILLAAGSSIAALVDPRRLV